MLATLARYVPMAHDIRLSAFDMRLTPLDIFADANEHKDTSERSDLKTGISFCLSFRAPPPLGFPEKSIRFFGVLAARNRRICNAECGIVDAEGEDNVERSEIHHARRVHHVAKGDTKGIKGHFPPMPQKRFFRKTQRRDRSE